MSLSRSATIVTMAADGVLLAEGAGPDYVRAALAQAAPVGAFRVSVFSALSIAADRHDAYRWMAPVVADWLRTPNPAIDAHRFALEMRERFAAGGEAALVDMPREWWLGLGAIGSFEDAVEHIELLVDAGAHDVALFPAPELAVGRSQIDEVIRLCGSVAAKQAESPVVG